MRLKKDCCSAFSENASARKSDIGVGLTTNKAVNQFMIFKSRGTLVVLLWAFAAIFMCQFLANIPEHDSIFFDDGKMFGPIVAIFVTMLLYPVLGWLADSKCGRYRALKAGLWAMWSASIVTCIVSAVFSHNYSVKDT